MANFDNAQRFLLQKPVNFDISTEPLRSWKISNFFFKEQNSQNYNFISLLK